ncbi:Hpt domain-containing protein [Flavivirga sp. Y03]|uniref:Hpt domain-containing protein n=2 Tax=Flavivirga algicola TaxID=2729136 RepID=A0ABX1RYR4_9FLAO|nr:Hpt domain-containing protein [Flavivirga algicola]
MEQPNLSYIYSMSGGDKDFEKKLINIIKAEFPEEKKTYYKNINSDNFNKASENVHKLKHKISILGLEKSYEMAVDYENNLKKASTVGRKDFDAILQLITDFINTL